MAVRPGTVGITGAGKQSCSLNRGAGPRRRGDFMATAILAYPVMNVSAEALT